MKMIHQKIDLNLFLVLEAIDTHRSVTRAAQVLHLTQSAVSHALGRLRASFDDPLFERQGRRMEPTPLTQAMMAEVRAHLDGLRQAAAAPTEFEPESAKRTFQLGFRDLLETIAFPELMQRWHARAPGVHFVSSRVDPPRLAQDLRTGALDVAIDLAQPVDADICHQAVSEEPLGVVTAAGQAAPDLDAYLSAGHVLVTLRRSGPEVVDQVLAGQGLHRMVRLRCQHYYAACHVIARSELIMTMPQSYARLMAKQLPLAVHPLPLQMPALPIRLYWAARRDADPANRWLREQVLASVLMHLPDTAAD